MRKKSADTMGIVVDLTTAEGLALANEAARVTGDSELRNVIKSAQDAGMRFVIAAGGFNGKGLIATFCGDEQILLKAFRIVNARMDKIGSGTTVWMILPEPSMELLLQEVFK